MKTYSELFIYFPYEYTLLQAYFEDMAKKGWKLQSIEGHWLFATLTFEQCTPQTIYYYTDYTADYKLFTQKSDKTSDYRRFIEEYGYSYVCGLREIMVFSSDTKMSQLKEDNEESKAQLKKATWYRVITYLLGVLMLLVYLMFFSVQITSDILSTNFGLLYSVLYYATLFVIAISIIPPFAWLLFGKQTKCTKIMKQRVKRLVFMIGLLLISSIKAESGLIVEMLFTIGFSLFVLAYIWYVLRIVMIKSKKIIFACIVMMWGVGVVAYTYHLQAVSERNDEIPILLSNDVLHIASTNYPKTTYKSSYVMKKETIVYENGIFYEVMFINDTPFYDLVKSFILHETNIKNSTQRDDVMIYERSFDYLIMKDHMVLVVNQDAYGALNHQDYEKLFQQIEEAF